MKEIEREIEKVKWEEEEMRKVGKWLSNMIVEKKEERLYAKKIFILLKYMKQHVQSQMEMVIESTAVDYKGEGKRYEVVYIIRSITYNKKIVIKRKLGEGQYLESITSIYKGGEWMEREIWDMYGIKSKGNKDMRRLLTDYGYEGNPLKRNWPVSGYKEIVYDENEKRVGYKKIEMPQEKKEKEEEEKWGEDIRE